MNALRIALGLLLLSATLLNAASLAWTGGESRDWNTTATNWSGPRSHFQSGDAVTFGSTGEVFIGTAGVAQDVAPGGVTVNGGPLVFRGGDITSGALVVYGWLLFTNYTHFLSYPGGTVIEDARLQFDATQLADGSQVQIGAGPIAVRGASVFEVAARTNRDLYVPNELEVALPAGDLSPGIYSRGRRVEFSGNGLLSGGRFNVGAGSSSCTQVFSGTWTLNQSGAWLEIFVWSGQVVFSGAIVDGPGTYSTRLILDAYGGNLIIAGTNSYRHGTTIRDGWITLTPTGNLGVGDVECAGSAELFLTAPNNISRGATLKMGNSRVNIAEGVTIRVRALSPSQQFGTWYSNGVFSATNSWWISGKGVIRVGTNAPPIDEIKRLSDGRRVITFTAPKGSYYDVETATSLAPPNWKWLTNFSRWDVDRTLRFTNDSVSNERFFRIVAP